MKPISFDEIDQGHYHIVKLQDHGHLTDKIKIRRSGILDIRENMSNANMYWMKNNAQKCSKQITNFNIAEAERF